MKTFSWLIVATLAASPAFAASERGYIEGTGGVQGSSEATFSGWSTSGSGGTQVGARVAPHLFVIGEVGKFKSLQPAAAQASLNGTVADLSSSMGIDVTGQANLSASYGFGGARFQGTTKHHLAPYAMAGLGVARVTPSASLIYAGGFLPSQAPSGTPEVGANVTTQLVSDGVFVQPTSSTSLMFSSSAGMTVDVARHVTADVGYRFSRINATTPINTQGVAFGVGLRF